VTAASDIIIIIIITLFAKKNIITKYMIEIQMAGRQKKT